MNSTLNINTKNDSSHKILGAKIKHFRKIKGITQKQLGIETGVTFQQIQKYESGANSPSLDRLKQISEILNISLYDLIDTSGNQDSDNGDYANRVMYYINQVTNKSLKDKIVEIVRIMSNAE